MQVGMASRFWAVLLLFFSVANVSLAGQQSVGEILRGVGVAQTFKADTNLLRSVSVQLATCGRINTCDIVLELTRLPEGTQVASRTLSGSEVEDNHTYSLDFEPILDSAGKDFKFRLYSSNAVPGNAFTAWVVPDSELRGSLTINDSATPGGLLIHVAYKDWEIPFGIRAVILLLLGLTGAGLVSVASFSKLEPYLKWVLWFAIAAPMVYIFIAIQYSAITVPFWDHCELSRFFFMHDEGTLKLSNFWAPHNHSRPLVYRAIYYLNGRLTRWDIRSEYIYHIASIYITFLVLFLAFRRLCPERQWNLAQWAILALTSIIYFSPAGHNNHWWSMMSQLTFAGLFIHYALIQIAFAEGRWKGHILAAIGCWLATYTLTNGLIAFGAAALVTQFAQPKLFRISRHTLFWAANIILVLVAYMPGLPSNMAGETKPGLLAMAWFVCVYIGAPVAGLLSFPYETQFFIPRETLFSGSLGLGVILLSAYCVYYFRAAFIARSKAAMLFAGYAIFSLGSAVITARGRAAFDEYGVAAANSSRYTIYSCFLLIGILFLLFEACSHLEILEHSAFATLPFQKWRRAAWAASFSIFIGLATLAYIEGTKVYVESHATDLLLCSAYPENGGGTSSDFLIHPSREFALEMKAKLRRLKIGPYRTGSH